MSVKLASYLCSFPASSAASSIASYLYSFSAFLCLWVDSLAKNLKLTASRIVCVTRQKIWSRGHWSRSQSEKHQKWHFGAWCTLSFIRLPVDSLARGLKLTAIRVVCVTFQKILPRGHRSRSRSENPWKTAFWGRVYPFISPFTCRCACKRPQINGN